MTASVLKDTLIDLYAFIVLCVYDFLEGIFRGRANNKGNSSCGIMLIPTSFTRMSVS